MNPIDDNSNRDPGQSTDTGPNFSSDQAVFPPPDTRIRNTADGDAVYTDEEEALVQERLKNLGYL